MALIDKKMHQALLDSPRKKSYNLIITSLVVFAFHVQSINLHYNKASLKYISESKKQNKARMVVRICKITYQIDHLKTSKCLPK